MCIVKCIGPRFSVTVESALFPFAVLLCLFVAISTFEKEQDTDLDSPCFSIGGDERAFVKVWASFWIFIWFVLFLFFFRRLGLALRKRGKCFRLSCIMGTTIFFYCGLQITYFVLLTQTEDPADFGEVAVALEILWIFLQCCLVKLAFREFDAKSRGVRETTKYIHASGFLAVTLTIFWSFGQFFFPELANLSLMIASQFSMMTALILSVRLVQPKVWFGKVANIFLAFLASNVISASQNVLILIRGMYHYHFSSLSFLDLEMFLFSMLTVQIIPAMTMLVNLPSLLEEDREDKSADGYVQVGNSGPPKRMKSGFAIGDKVEVRTYRENQWKKGVVSEILGTRYKVQVTENKSMQIVAKDRVRAVGSQGPIGSAEKKQKSRGKILNIWERRKANSPNRLLPKNGGGFPMKKFSDNSSDVSANESLKKKSCCNCLFGWITTVEKYIAHQFVGIYILIAAFLFASWGGHATCFLPSEKVNSSTVGWGMFLARFGATPFYVLIPFEILAISYGFQTLAQSTIFGTFVPHNSGPGLLNYHRRLVPGLMIFFVSIHIAGHVMIVQDRHSILDQRAVNGTHGFPFEDLTLTSPLYSNFTEPLEHIEPILNSVGNITTTSLMRHARRALKHSKHPTSAPTVAYLNETIVPASLVTYLESWDDPNNSAFIYPWATGFAIFGCLISVYLVYLLATPQKYFCKLLSYDGFLVYHAVFAWLFIFILAVHGIGPSWHFPSDQFEDPDLNIDAYATAFFSFVTYIFISRPVTIDKFLTGVAFAVFFIFSPWPFSSWTGYFGKAYMWIPILFTILVVNLNKLMNILSATNITCATFSLEGQNSKDDYLVIFIPLEEDILDCYKGGEWILVSAPELNLGTWHPFTCIKAEGGIIIHIKIMRSPSKLKGWTKKLQAEFLQFQLDQRRQSRWGSIAQWLLTDYNEIENLLPQASAITGLPGGAKLPLQITGPYFSSLASCVVTPEKFFVMIALGVGFTGCATLFSKMKSDQLCVFHRAKGVYANYVKQFCRKENITVEPNPADRNEFWLNISDRIRDKCHEKGVANVSIVYCGSVAGVQSLYSLLNSMIEHRSRYKKVNVYAESFG